MSEWEYAELVVKPSRPADFTRPRTAADKEWKVEAWDGRRNVLINESCTARPLLSPWLEQLGADEWELVGCETDRYIGGPYSTDVSMVARYHFFFKREVLYEGDEHEGGVSNPVDNDLIFRDF